MAFHQQRKKIFTVTSSVPICSPSNRCPKLFNALSTAPPYLYTHNYSCFPYSKTVLTLFQCSPHLLLTFPAPITGNDCTSSVTFQVSPTASVQSKSHTVLQSTSVYDSYARLLPGSSNSLYSNVVTRTLVSLILLKFCSSYSRLVNE